MAGKVETKSKRKRASFTPLAQEETVPQETAFKSPPVEAVVEPEPTEEKEEESKPLMVVEEAPVAEEKTSEEVSETPETVTEGKTEPPAASDFAPDESAESTQDEEIVTQSKTNVLILALVAFLSFVCGILLTFIAVRVIDGSTSPTGDANVSPSPSSEVTSTPTPTPAPAVSRSDINVEVLNGSGTAGVAKKAATVFENKGYKVIKTGNADKSSYEESILVVKENTAQEIVDMIKEDMKDDYAISEVATTLEDSSNATIRFIIGKK